MEENDMIIDEQTYKKMPDHLRALFDKLPNHGSDEVLMGFPNTNKQAKCKTDDKSGWQDQLVGGSVSKPTERKLFKKSFSGI